MEPQNVLCVPSQIYTISPVLSGLDPQDMKHCRLKACYKGDILCEFVFFLALNVSYEETSSPVICFNSK